MHTCDYAVEGWSSLVSSHLCAQFMALKFMFL